VRVGLTGARSTIAKAFVDYVEKRHPAKVTIGKLADLSQDLDAYLICTGYLAGKTISTIGPGDAAMTWRLNYVDVARFCDQVLAANPRARICVLGSESAFKGSYDMAYAGAKAALHTYVETKTLTQPRQMLVALAPHIVWDSNMTQARADLGDLKARGTDQRMGRWLTAAEIAREAAHLLIDASPALSGQVIRMRP
jgi:NAD(P)-dependent dehydrogenase (short-subunit alcohol dehydrogenase family)